MNFNGCEIKCVGVLKGKEVQSMIIALRRWLILLGINLFWSVVRVQLSQMCWGIRDVQLHQFVCNDLACVYIIIVLLHLVVCYCIILNGFDLDRSKSVSEGPCADFVFKQNCGKILNIFLYRDVCRAQSVQIYLWLAGGTHRHVQAEAGVSLTVLSWKFWHQAIAQIEVAQQYVTKLMVILNFKCKAQMLALSIAKWSNC